MRMWFAALLLSARAYADEATAQIAYRQAEELVKAGKWAEACPLYDASYKADPQIGVLLHLAECHEKVGLTASAWSEYNDAVELAHRKGDQRESLAQARVDALAPKLAKLRIAKPDPAPAGLVVKRDGTDVTVLVGTDMPIDPGEHDIVATAPGFTERREHVTIGAEPKVTRVDLALETAPSTEPPKDIIVPPPAPGPAPAPAPPSALSTYSFEAGFGVSTSPPPTAMNVRAASGHQVTLRAGFGKRFGQGPLTYVVQLEYAHKGGSYDFVSLIPGNLGSHGVGYNLHYLEVPFTVRYRVGPVEFAGGAFAALGLAADWGSNGENPKPQITNFKPYNLGLTGRASLWFGPVAVSVFADTELITPSDDVDGGISTFLLVVGYEAR